MLEIMVAESQTEIHCIFIRIVFKWNIEFVCSFGDLLISGTNSDKLIGKYHGYGKLDAGAGDIKMMIRIAGVTGYFADASGDLSEKNSQNYGLLKNCRNLAIKNMYCFLVFIYLQRIAFNNLRRIQCLLRGSILP